MDLAAVLDKALLDEYEQWPKAMKIWPSDLGVALGHEHDGCQRAFYDKCRDAPRRDRTPGEVLMFKMGDLAETYLIGLLTKHLPAHGWRVVGTQTRCESFGISGRLDVEIQRDYALKPRGRHPDGTTDDVADGYKVVVDVKTKRGAAFSFLNEAKPGNELQVQCYLPARNADEGGLLYADREGQNGFRYFQIPREDHRPKKAVEILTAIRDSPTPPPTVGLKLKRVENKGDDSVYLNVPWQITWCDLKKCACKQALPKGTVPEKIVAKIKKPESGPRVVTFTDDGKGWEEITLNLLRAAFPHEAFDVQVTTPLAPVGDVPAPRKRAGRAQPAAR